MKNPEDMIEKAGDVAKLLKIISNPNRLMIVCKLLDEEMSVGDIETRLGIRQPTLSRELGHLREANILSTRKQSKVVFYRLENPKMERLIQAICQSLGDAEPSNLPERAARPIVSFNPRPKFKLQTQARSAHENAQ